MKGFLRIFWLIAAFIGAFGYNLVAANTVQMNYKGNQEVIDNLLGLDIDYDDYDDDDYDEDDEADVELEGVKRYMRGKTYSTSEAVKRIGRAQKKRRRRSRYQNMRRTVSPTQRFIVGSMKKLTPDFQKLILNKELEFTDGVIYYTKEYTNISGNKDIIHSNDDIGVGYSNLLENGVVPSTLTMAADFVGFAFNDYDSATENIFTNLFVKSYTRAAFANAEVEVKVGNKVVLTVPVFMMQETRFFKGSHPASEHWGYNLEKPLLIKAGSRLQFTLKMADGTAVANAGTNRTGVRFILAGSGTKDKV